MASKIIVDQLQKTGGSTAALTLPTSNASANEFLQNDGAGALSWASAAAGFINMEVYTASGTWTKTDNNPTKIVVEVQGAGGSGSRHTASANVCSGAGGGYARKFLDVTDIDTVTVVVGAGGASQTSSDTAGIAGGLSSFIKATGSGSFTNIVGNGGTGGIISGWGAGPIGGTGTGGDLNIQGGRGWMGGDGTNGGGSFLGVQGVSTSYSTGVVLDGLGYGAGGGGAYTTAGSGVGAPGIVIVWEYK